MSLIMSVFVCVGPRAPRGTEPRRLEPRRDDRFDLTEPCRAGAVGCLAMTDTLTKDVADVAEVAQRPNER